jgi:hypothetical protein
MNIPWWVYAIIYAVAIVGVIVVVLTRGRKG